MTRNPDYWKKDRPYLDGIEYTIMPNRSTALLAFVAGKFDMTWPYDVAIPLLKDVQSQAPQAICEITPLNASRNLIINRNVPPFDNPEIRRAMALSLDRKAFIDILDEGQGDIGGAMLPPPAGVWGLPPEMLKGLPGYDPEIEKNRAEARAIMERAGLWAGQPAPGQAVGPQHPDCPRPGDHPDRPAEDHPYRCRTRPDRNRQLVSKSNAEGLHGRPQS